VKDICFVQKIFTLVQPLTRCPCDDGRMKRNPIEAEEELGKLPPQHQAHPAVLEVRWEICARAKKWDAALEIASALVQVAPDHPLGWVHRSFCLHESERTAEARDNLLRAVDKFPEDAIMLYNLACYECHLGRLEQTKHWLQAAFEVGGAGPLRTLDAERASLAPFRGIHNTTRYGRGSLLSFGCSPCCLGARLGPDSWPAGLSCFARICWIRRRVCSRTSGVIFFTICSNRLLLAGSMRVLYQEFRREQIKYWRLNTGDSKRAKVAQPGGLAASGLADVGI